MGKRRRSALEEIIKAFGATCSDPWPHKKQPPAGVETFVVPKEVRKILCIAHEREKAAARLIGDGPNCNDGGMWQRRHILADGIEYLVNDYIRAVYNKNDRYGVDYYADFKCTLTFG